MPEEKPQEKRQETMNVYDFKVSKQQVVYIEGEEKKLGLVYCPKGDDYFVLSSEQTEALKQIAQKRQEKPMPVLKFLLENLLESSEHAKLIPAVEVEGLLVMLDDFKPKEY